MAKIALGQRQEGWKLAEVVCFAFK